MIPFFGGVHDGVSGHEFYRTFEGADCILEDLRVVRRRKGPVEVILGTRELGASFADSAAVRFDYYKLSRGGMPGESPFYFEHTRTVLAKRPYCDVNDAFQRELGLGTAGVGSSESVR